MSFKSIYLHQPVTISSDLRSHLEWATPEKAVNILKLFADIPAPSQVSSCTKGPAVNCVLKDWELTNYKWDSNFKGTGNGLLTIGDSMAAPVWIIAHWDIISFLIKGRAKEGYELVPFHHHLMMKGSQPGQVLRFDLASSSYKVIATGIIKGGEKPVYSPEGSTELKAGDRVVYNTPMQSIGENIYSGQMDNAAGCAGSLMAGYILSKLTGVSVHICFVDEEEGPVVVGSTSFSRGSRRLLRFLPPPELAIVVDHHTVRSGDDNPHMGKGALYKEYASGTSGGVTPPWVYETVRELAKVYATTVCLNENQFAEVSRSDCVSLLEVTPNIVLCGPPTVGRHYMNGVYKSSTFDIAHLARSLALIAHHFQYLNNG